jgi:sugar lactone lactonase YvrE
MNRVSFRCVRILVLVALAVAAFNRPAAAQRFPEPLDPATYESPSGKFTLTVEPSDIYGRYAGSYRVVKEGKEIWAKTLPFTFSKASITDTGVVAGFAYTLGEEGFGKTPDEPRPGDLIVAIIDPAGKPRLKQTTRRQPRPGFDAPPPFPTASGLVVDEPNDRLILRVNDYGDDEIWWTYRLSTGSVLDKRHPRSAMPYHEPDRSIFDARLVPGTPLVLVHWSHNDGRAGARYTLVDPSEGAKPVWSLELSGDYVVKGDEAAQEKLLSWIQEHGGILATRRTNQFDLLFAAEAKRITFEVQQQPSGDWSVREVARTAFSIKPPENPKFATVRGRPLKELPPLILQAARDDSPIRDVGQFVIDAQGRIAFIREDKDASRFVLVDQTGKRLRELSLPATAVDNESKWSGHCWVGGSRFVVTLSATAREGKSRAWWVDVDSGKMQAIRGFDCPSITRLVGAADGRFVAVAKDYHRYTIDTSVIGFDAEGRRAWELREDENGTQPGALFHVVDVALTSDVEIAVLESHVNRLTFFDRDGLFLRTIDLEKAWGRKPSYVSALVAAADGELVVEESERTAPYVRMTRAGTVRGSVQPKRADGRAISNVHTLRRDPEGRFWLSDRRSLMRLDDRGTVDRFLGAVVSPTRLGRIAGIRVDPGGRIYAVDSRTGSIHVFDQTGKLLHVCQTRPTDFESDILFPVLTTDDKGDLYLGMGTDSLMPDKRTYAHFSASGKRLEDVLFPAGTCFLQPQSGAIAALQFDYVRLVDPSGKTLRTFDRRPDRGWLDHPQSLEFAADGSLAIVADRSRTRKATVNLYKPNGDPIRTIRLPESAGRFPRVAYDGRRLLVAGDEIFLIYDSTGRQLLECEPPIKVAQGQYYYPYLLPGGKELALFDGEDPVLHRFDFP